METGMRTLLGVMAILACLAYASVKAAPPFPMTLTVCKDYKVSKRGDGMVFIRCPGVAWDKPFFTIPGHLCPNPRVPVRTPTTVTIDCG